MQQIIRSILRTGLLAPQIASLPVYAALRPFSQFQVLRPQSLLTPVSLQTQFSAGLKHVVRPRRRCIHCYMVVEDEMTYVFCDKYPRHKQVTRKSKRDARNEMVMTHATQGGKQNGKGTPRGRMHMLTQAGFRMDY